MFRTLTPILSIITAIVLFVTLAHPQYLEIQQVRKEINDYNTATNDYNNFTKRVNDLVSKKNGTSVSDMERLEMLVPEVHDNTRVIVDLETLARKNGMLFGNIDADEKTDLAGVPRSGEGADVSVKDELISSEVSFDVIGTYDQFKNLLRDIESSLTLMDITNIEFSASESKFQQYSVTVRTYALSNAGN